MPSRSPGAEVLPVRAREDLLRVRQATRSLAVSAGLSLVDQTKLVTAVSELARRVLAHGGAGQAAIERVEAGGRSGIRVQVSDDGPGMAYVEAAPQDGFSAGIGPGPGLSEARLMVDELELETSAGAGTRVTIVKWKR